MTNTPPTITVTRDHQTTTARGVHLSIDATHRPETDVRKGWHFVIDDDTLGRATRVRLHVYGLAGWRELRALMDKIELEIEKKEGAG